MLKLIVCENREMARQEWLKDEAQGRGSIFAWQCAQHLALKTTSGHERRYVSQHTDVALFVGLDCTVELRGAVASETWMDFALRHNRAAAL